MPKIHIAQLWCWQIPIPHHDTFKMTHHIISQEKRTNCGFHLGLKLYPTQKHLITMRPAIRKFVQPQERRQAPHLCRRKQLRFAFPCAARRTLRFRPGTIFQGDYAKPQVGMLMKPRHLAIDLKAPSIPAPALHRQ